MNTYGRAIQSLRPGAQFVLRGHDLEWLGADEPPPHAEVLARAQEIEQRDALRRFSSAVEWHIEATARARDYASSVHCVSYMHSTIEAWAAEAAAFAAWRDAVWIAVYAALDAWQAGGAAPTVDALIASLPPMEWPEA